MRYKDIKPSFDFFYNLHLTFTVYSRGPKFLFPGGQIPGANYTTYCLRLFAFLCITTMLESTYNFIK